MEKLQCAGNFKEKLENAFKAYADTVFRVALLQTKNKTYADDVLGEVFLRLSKSIEKLESNEHIKAWLIRATVNCSKTYMKKLMRESVPLEDDIPAFDKTQINEVYSAVLSLPKKYRTVIHLYYYEDLSIKEISAFLSQSTSATKMQLKRAKEKMKTILGDEF